MDMDDGSCQPGNGVCFLCEAINSKWQGVCVEAKAEELSKVSLSGRDMGVNYKGPCTVVRKTSVFNSYADVSHAQPGIY